MYCEILKKATTDLQQRCRLCVLLNYRIESCRLQVPQQKAPQWQSIWHCQQLTNITRQNPPVQFYRSTHSSTAVHSRYCDMFALAVAW
jgi:hypothetical protein